MAEEMTKYGAVPEQRSKTAQGAPGTMEPPRHPQEVAAEQKRNEIGDRLQELEKAPIPAFVKGRDA